MSTPEKDKKGRKSKEFSKKGGNSGRKTIPQGDVMKKSHYYYILYTDELFSWCGQNSKTLTLTESRIYELYTEVKTAQEIVSAQLNILVRMIQSRLRCPTPASAYRLAIVDRGTSLFLVSSATGGTRKRSPRRCNRHLVRFSFSQIKKHPLGCFLIWRRRRDS